MLPGPRLHWAPARPDPESPVPRPPLPSDVYRLRIPTEPRLSPDGRVAVVALTTAAPLHDGYRTALWLVPTTGGEPRRLTLGVRNGSPSALLAGRPDPRVPVGSASDRRTGAGPPDRGVRSRGRHPGPPAPARWWRGAPPDRPATRRGGLRVVAGWRLAGRHVVIARGDVRGGCAAAPAGNPPPRP